MGSHADKSIFSNSALRYCWLLAPYVDNSRSAAKSGNPSRKIKLVSLHCFVKFKQGCLKVMMRVKLLMVLFVRLLLVWYLEGILTLDRLNKILRSHYGAKNTSELYQVLASLCQKPKESPQACLMNALDLRQQILFACGEEDDDTSLQYDSGHIQRLFLWSVETGLQDESIRAKIHPFLKDPNVTDEVLMQQMSMATSAEKERDKKLRDNTTSKPPALSVSAISDGLCNDKEESKKCSPQNDILAAIGAIKSEVEALKTEVRKKSSQSAPPGKWPERRRSPLCSSCLESKKEYCNHCFKCGSDSHFARGCRKQLNGNRLLPRDRK